MLPLAALLLALGCRLHMAQVEVQRPFSRADFEAIGVGRDDRAQLLERLGPPDHLTYSPRDEVHEYAAGRHRATDLRFFVPGELARLPGLGAVLGILSFFFSLLSWMIYSPAQDMEGWMGAVLRHVSVLGRVDAFAKGSVGLGDLVFFLSFIFFGLFLCVQAIESQRWRGAGV